MRRFELGMSLDYCSNWSVDKAINEIFQNCIDESTKSPDNGWYFDYDKDNQVLRLGNKSSKLETRTLLLGVSSKRDDDSTIGQHGEGYKVATVVLLRNNIGLKIYNFNKKEIWTARVIESKWYSEKVGVFDIESTDFFKPVPNHDLIFELTNISEEIYNNVKSNNLWLTDDLGKKVETEKGTILLDPSYKGKVYVEGLFVCTNNNLTYGYSLKPSLIKLDRDRGLIDSYSLQYNLGKLWSCVSDIELIKKSKDLWDCADLIYHSYSADTDMSSLYDSVYEDFKKEHGDDALPVVDMVQFNRLNKKGYQAVMVSQSDFYYITHSGFYTGVDLSVDEDDLYDKLLVWLSKASRFLPDHLVKEGEELLNNIEKRLE